MLHAHTSTLRARVHVWEKHFINPKRLHRVALKRLNKWSRQNETEIHIFVHPPQQMTSRHLVQCCKHIFRVLLQGPFPPVASLRLFALLPLAILPAAIPMMSIPPMMAAARYKHSVQRTHSHPASCPALVVHSFLCATASSHNCFSMYIHTHFARRRRTASARATTCDDAAVYAPHASFLYVVYKALARARRMQCVQYRSREICTLAHT